MTSTQSLVHTIEARRKRTSEWSNDGADVDISARYLGDSLYQLPARQPSSRLEADDARSKRYQVPAVHRVLVDRHRLQGHHHTDHAGYGSRLCRRCLCHRGERLRLDSTGELAHSRVRLHAEASAPQTPTILHLRHEVGGSFDSRPPHNF